MSVERTDVGGVPAFVASPLNSATSAVIVLHQAYGYSPQIERWLTQLADSGHLAVAPLLLHHRGVDAVNPMERFGGDMAAFAQFLPSDGEARKDIAAVLAALTDRGLASASIAVLGFSYGGRVAYLTATEHPLAAAIGVYPVGIQRKNFHGNEELPALADRPLQTPWLGLCGEEDFLYEPGELDDWEKALAPSQVPARLVRYPDAGHGFDVDAPGPPGAPHPYNEAAASDASHQIEQFLADSLD